METVLIYITEKRTEKARESKRKLFPRCLFKSISTYMNPLVLWLNKRLSAIRIKQNVCLI